MSWGWRIAFLYSGFVLLILTFVVASTKQNFDLVTEDYYAAEVAYQQQIDRQRNARALADPMTIRYEAASQQVIVDYPSDQPHAKGQVQLYRPSNAGMDRTFEVAPNADFLQFLPTQDLIKGLWKVQVTWQVEGVEYYHEQVVIL
jgi:hypothetical protein